MHCIKKGNQKLSLLESSEIVQTPKIMSDDSRRVKIPSITPKNELSLLGNVHYFKQTNKQTNFSKSQEGFKMKPGIC